MQSGAGFVRTVMTAASAALTLSLEIEGFVKKGRKHIFSYLF